MQIRVRLRKKKRERIISHGLEQTRKNGKNINMYESTIQV